MRKYKHIKGLVFEGEALEKYKALRDRWIMLTAISSFLPLALTCIISWYNGNFKFIDIFLEGEIIMSLFSFTVPLMFDLFEIKKRNDINLTRAFTLCVLIVALQIVFYCLFRIDDSDQHIIRNILTSISFVFASWFCCIYSIRAIARHSENKEI